MKPKTIQAYLKQVSKDYYDGAPSIPDEVFDKLAELAKFEEVGTVSGDTPHLYQLLSLEKFYPANGDNPNRDFTSPIETPKLDGACISALYIEGCLHTVLTRGDGIKGKNVTDKFTDGKLIPLTLDVEVPVQLTLEVVAPNTVENARNYCAGALNLKSLEEFRTRNIKCVVHGMSPSILGLFTLDMEFLHRSGFNVVTRGDYSDTPQDGVVVRENSSKRYEEWGYTNHHPRGAYALKTRKEAVKTRLLGVIWQVGKSGKVTPVAQLDPVDIDGAMVSRASLHNIAFIESLELDIGDMVEVIRSGEIIPYILGKADE